jgi:hypothetical protein
MYLALQHHGLGLRFLPRLSEPLAHSLELWFLHVCVRYVPIT